MVVAFYFRLHLAYFPRPVVAIFARPEHEYRISFFVCCERRNTLRVYSEIKESMQTQHLAFIAVLNAEIRLQKQV